jgi:hypothetical protein
LAGTYRPPSAATATATGTSGGLGGGGASSATLRGSSSSAGVGAPAGGLGASVLLRHTMDASGRPVTAPAGGAGTLRRVSSVTKVADHGLVIVRHAAGVREQKQENALTARGMSRKFDGGFFVS